MYSLLVSIHSPGKADASGLLSCVSEVLKFMGVENILEKDSVLGVEGRQCLLEEARMELQSMLVTILD